MKFNQYVWELYRESRQGKEAIVRFSKPCADLADDELRFVPFQLFDQDEGATDEAWEIDVPEFIKEQVQGVRLPRLVDANRFLLESQENKGFSLTEVDGESSDDAPRFPASEDDWYDFVSPISVGLYMAHPEFFLPYNFRCEFNQLEEIHGEFGIPLPPIPGKNDKQGRARYYGAINQNWQEFRFEHQMTAAEMCAFLYDFAAQFVTPLADQDLPAPSKVWLVSGGAGGDADFDFVDNAIPSTVSRWAGNTNVRRGDILLMYLISPRCYIDSIWRAASDGFIDPFFHYHGQVRICAPIKTKPVLFSELKQHALLSQKSAVKGNFQGPSGKAPFTYEEYEAVLEIMRQKGQDVTLLPRIPLPTCLPEIELLSERDVEVHLIEPLLARLGYNESDWVRNMPVKMGRGERNYPDYSIGPKAKRGEESAKMVCESKYQLSAHREFADAFYQAKSYALRLRCKIMMTAAKEGIWVFPPVDGTFEIKKYIHRSWNELCHPDSFHEVLALIGKCHVLG